MIKALILAISYRSSAQAVAFVENLSAQSSQPQIAVMLVDNGALQSREGQLEGLETSNGPIPGGIVVLTPESNLGYFGGADFALNHHLKAHVLPEWTVVCNVDLAIRDRDFFERLFARYDVGPPAVVAPSILLERVGRDQNPYLRLRPSRRRMQFLAMVFRRHATAAGYQRLALAKQWLMTARRWKNLPGNETAEPQDIYAGHGSFMIFHRSYFDAGGNLRHGAFLFGEEVFVGETTRRLGLRTVFDPRLRVIHRGSNANVALQRPELFGHMREATAFLAKTYFPA